MSSRTTKTLTWRLQKARALMRLLERCRGQQMSWETDQVHRTGEFCTLECCRTLVSSFSLTVNRDVQCKRAWVLLPPPPVLQSQTSSQGKVCSLLNYFCRKGMPAAVEAVLGEICQHSSDARADAAKKIIIIWHRGRAQGQILRCCFS